jgi:hypothetical protein
MTSPILALCGLCGARSALCATLHTFVATRTQHVPSRIVAPVPRMWPLYILAILAAASVGAVIWDDRTSERRRSTRHASTAGSKPTPDRGHRRVLHRTGEPPSRGRQTPATRAAASTRSNDAGRQVGFSSSLMQGLEEIRASSNKQRLRMAASSSQVHSMIGLEALRERAKEFAQQDNFGAEAVRANTEILARCPEDVDAWNRLGRCHLKSGRPEEAERAFRRALQVSPDSKIASNGVADAVAARSTRLASLIHHEAMPSPVADTLEARHEAYLRSAGLPARGLRAATRRPRITHCWKCKGHLDSRTFAECLGCNGIICGCGACFCR